MYYKMVVITVEKYANAGVHTITVENKKLFWVKNDLCAKRLGFKKYTRFMPVFFLCIIKWLLLLLRNMQMQVFIQ